MKMLLAASALALAAGAADAAVVRYDYTSPVMREENRGRPDYQFKMFIVVDTDLVSGNSVEYTWYDQYSVPSDPAVVSGTQQPYTFMQIAFDENWRVSTYGISFNNQGGDFIRSADENGAFAFLDLSTVEKYGWAGGPGKWSTTVLEGELAPVPVPAAGALLLAALGGLGVLRKRARKA